MTYEEMKKKFPIGCRVTLNKRTREWCENNSEDKILVGAFGKIVGYHRDDIYLKIEWENSQINKSYNGLWFSVEDFEVVEESEGRDGQIYNPFTGRWSWF